MGIFIAIVLFIILMFYLAEMKKKLERLLVEMADLRHSLPKFTTSPQETEKKPDTLTSPKPDLPDEMPPVKPLADPNFIVKSNSPSPAQALAQTLAASTINSALENASMVKAEPVNSGTSQATAHHTIPKLPDIETPPPEATLPKVDTQANSYQYKPSAFEERAREILRQIWRWICVDEEYRPANLTAEYAIATTWLVRVAALLLICGIGYFIKYSHDNNLFAPQYRLIIGALVGVGLAIGSLRWSGGRYRLVALGMGGVGITTQYFVCFAAAEIYKLMPLPLAFALMIGVTVGGAALAIRQNALLLAVISLLGGYAAPYLTMHNINLTDFNIILGYLLVLAAGELLIARYRNWPLLSFLAFAGNWLWYFALPDGREFLPGIITFGVLFFMLFSLLPLVYNIRNNIKISLYELLLLLTNAACYLLGPVWIMAQYSEISPQSSLLTWGAALFYTLQIAYLVHKKHEDRNLMLSLMVLAVINATVSIPLWLNECWIFFAWSIQAVGLLYLSVRIRSRFMEYLAYALYLLTAATASIYYWVEFIFKNQSYWSGMKDRFLSLGVLALAIIAGYIVQKYRNRYEPIAEVGQANDITIKEFPAIRSQIFLWCGFWFFMLFGIGEINMLKSIALNFSDAVFTWWWLAGLIFTIARLLLVKDKVSRFFSIVITLFLLANYFTAFIDIRPLPLDYSPVLGAWRLARITPLCLTFAVIWWFLAKKRPEDVSLQQFFAWLGGSLWFLYSSMELSIYLKWLFPNTVTGGVSLLWGGYAILLLWFGIRKKVKALRYSALVLFAATVIKIFMFDLQDLSTLARIGIMLLIGVIMMLAAGIYMKFRERL